MGNAHIYNAEQTPVTGRSDLIYLLNECGKLNHIGHCPEKRVSTEKLNEYILLSSLM